LLRELTNYKQKNLIQKVLFIIKKNKKDFNHKITLINKINNKKKMFLYKLEFRNIKNKKNKINYKNIK